MERVIVKIRAKSLNPAEQEELSFTLVSRGNILDRVSPVELELSQYVRVRELNGHWEGVMPVVLSDLSSQSRDVDDFRRMVSFLRNKGYAGRSQMETKSVYLSPSDAVDENGFTILKLKFRKVPSFLDRPMRQLSKRHSDSEVKRKSSESVSSSQNLPSEGDQTRRASESGLGPSLQNIAENGSQISCLAQSLLPKRSGQEPAPADDWTISEVTAGSATMDLQSSLLPAKPTAPESLVTPPASPLTPDGPKEHRAIDRFDRPAFKYSLLLSMADRHSAWVFGAVAELIDNSVDAGAGQVEIGITHSFCCQSHPGPALFIQDNGQGMTHREMQAMMEFGHDYVPPQSQTQGAERIGQYGVGFKSSAMRLGQSSLVFSHSKKEQTFSLGFLSLPYNRGRSSVSVPVLTFHADSFQPLQAYSSAQDVENALHDVTIHTGMNPIAIGSQFQQLKQQGASGTKILLFDLHKDDQKLDFTTDQDDIRISAPQSGQIGSLPQAPFLRNSRRHIATDVPPDYSLASYCSILFLQPRVKMLIRGCPVKSSSIADRMQNQKRKTFSVEEPGRGDPFSGPTEGEGTEKYVALVGFSPEDKDRALGGFMLYYRNRLILSYHRVGIQTKNLDLANGVVGVVDTRSLPVLNTKQDFNQNARHFVLLERHLAEIVEHYYWNFVNPDVKVTPLPTRVRTMDESFWLQCNHCTKWRRVKSWDSSKPVPKFWFCRMNADPAFNSCLAPEESQGRSEVTTGVTSGGQINTNGSNSNPNSKFSAFQSFPPAAKESNFKNSYPQTPESLKFNSKRRKT